MDLGLVEWDGTEAVGFQVEMQAAHPIKVVGGRLGRSWLRRLWGWCQAHNETTHPPAPGGDEYRMDQRCNQQGCFRGKL